MEKRSTPIVSANVGTVFHFSEYFNSYFYTCISGGFKYFLTEKTAFIVEANLYSISFDMYPWGFYLSTGLSF